MMMEINSYNDFKNAYKGATKGKRHECDLALGKLLMSDKARYEEYNQQMRQERREREQKHHTEG